MMPNPCQVDWYYHFPYITPNILVDAIQMTMLCVYLHHVTESAMNQNPKILLRSVAAWTVRSYSEFVKKKLVTLTP